MAILKNLTKYVPEMFRPHLPVLDDLKQKGPKKAIQHLADDGVTRGTAGLRIAGVSYLMIFYTPSPLVAYENMLGILSNVPFGRLMRDTHKLGGELMILTVVLHILRPFLTRLSKRP